MVGIRKLNVGIDRKNLIENLVKSGMTSNSWVPGHDLVQYSGPFFDEEEYIEAIDTLLSGWLVLGEKGTRFEKKFPKLFGKGFGSLTNSGSSANLLMMSALKSDRLYGFPKGTKVITAAGGFPTTVNPILQNGFEPVFVDIEIDTLNINVDQIEDAAKTGAKVITFAHVLGNPPNMDRVMEVVRDYDLVLLEDCCDARKATFVRLP